MKRRFVTGNHPFPNAVLLRFYLIQIAVSSLFGGFLEGGSPPVRERQVKRSGSRFDASLFFYAISWLFHDPQSQDGDFSRWKSHHTA